MPPEEQTSAPEAGGSPTLPQPAGLTLSEGASKLAERWAKAAGSGESTDTGGEHAQAQEEAPERQDLTSEDTGEALGHEEDASTDDGYQDDTGESAGYDYFESFDELAEATGHAKGDIMTHLRHPVKMPDGSTKMVNQHELVQAYQKGDAHRVAAEEALNERESALKAQESQLRDQYGQSLAQLNQTVAVAAATLEDQEKGITEYFDGLDWDRMRREAPADYAALQADRQRAIQAVQDKRNELAKQYSQAQQHVQAKAQSDRAELIKREQDALVKIRPEWRDESKRSEAGEQIGKYLQETYGVSEQELSQLYDHRILDIVYKALQFDAAGKGAEGLPARVKNGKGLLRPGARANGSTRGRAPSRKAEESRQRLSRTHKQSDAAAALADRWKAEGRNQTR